MKQLPLIDGLAASSIQLKAGDYRNVLDALQAHFPNIAKAEWQSRLARGRVLCASGEPAAATDPAKAGQTLHYYREVASEQLIPFVEHIVFEDEHLLIADKPHFLPVTPAGIYVQQTLLARLLPGRPNLVPLHRIDRTTAGLVMFAKRRDSRSAYQNLFQSQALQKTYLALAAALPDLDYPHRHCSRMVEGEPFFRMQEIAGVPNSETLIDVAQRGDDHWCYQLRPVSGKKHQLRVHMAALGAPILGDDFYPVVAEAAPGDYRKPMQLLAQKLEFVDPLSGRAQSFESLRTLRWPPILTAPESCTAE